MSTDCTTSCTTSAHKKRPGRKSPGLRFIIYQRLRNYIPQQGAGAAQDGAAGAQQLTGSGAQHGSGTVQHLLRRLKHFLNRPENILQRGLPQGSDYVSGSQQTGAGLQHTGSGTQHVGAGAQQVGSGAGQHRSQHDDFGLKHPNNPASADCGATDRLRAATANSERILLIEQFSGHANSET